MFFLKYQLSGDDLSNSNYFQIETNGKNQEYKKLVLPESNDQMLILCLSYIITTVTVNNLFKFQAQDSDLD